MKITEIHLKQSPNLGAFIVQALSTESPAPPVKKSIALEIWNEMPLDMKQKALMHFAAALVEHYRAINHYIVVLTRGNGRN